MYKYINYNMKGKLQILIGFMFAIMMMAFPTFAYSSWTSLSNPCDINGKCNDIVCLVGATAQDNLHLGQTLQSSFNVKSGNINFNSFIVNGSCIYISGTVPIASKNTWGISSVSIDPTWSSLGVNITDSSGISYSSSGGQTTDNGEMIIANANINVTSIAKYASSTATICSIYNANTSVYLGGGNYSGNNCNLNPFIVLSSGKYYFVEDGSAVSWTLGYNNGQSNPITKTNINYQAKTNNHAISSYSGGAEIVSITSYNYTTYDLELYLNHNQSNLTVNSGTVVNVSSNITQSQWVALLEDGTQINNGTNEVFNSSSWGVGTHNFTSYNTLNSALSQTFWLTVNAAQNSSLYYYCVNGVSYENNSNSVNSITCTYGCSNDTHVEYPIQGRTPLGDICNPYQLYINSWLLLGIFVIGWIFLIILALLVRRLNIPIFKWFLFLMIMLFMLYLSVGYQYPTYFTSQQYTITLLMVIITILLNGVLAMFL